MTSSVRVLTLVLRFAPWLLVVGGILVTLRQLDIWEWALASCAIGAGLAWLSLLLFMKRSPDGPFSRTVVQMVIATVTSLVLNSIGIANLMLVARVADKAIASADRFSIIHPVAERTAVISLVAYVLLGIWALGLPGYAWWRWSEQRARSSASGTAHEPARGA